MKSSWRFIVLIALILGGGLIVNAWEYLGEKPVQRKVLLEFPKEVGTWKQAGGDQRFDNATMEILGASDYLLRDYRNTDGRVANFYVGYYASQRNGATYHSPLNCLPGSGWTLSQPASITITPEGRKPFVANKYLVQNGDHKQLLIYWYQGRGRAVASEYWGKIYTVIDSVRMRRSDAAMVRVMLPVGTSEADATRAGADLAARAASALPEFIPD
jgi:EpsI family protein